MKRRFTFLMAAFALLAFLAIPMGMRGQTTVTQTTFSSVSGQVDDDANVSYACYKGGGTSAPAVNSNAIRLYQNSANQTGGYVVIGVSEGYVITSATIQSTMATTTGYKLTDEDPGDTTPAKSTFNVNNYSLSADTDYTVDGISTRFITFACFGSSSSARLYLSKISIDYQSDDVPQPETYTVTFDAGEGNFVGNTDFPSESNTKVAGTYTLPTATRSGYTFDGWLLAGNDEPLTGTYTVSGDADFTAQYTENTTPGPGGEEEWVLTPLSELTSSDVFVIEGNGFAMTNDNGVNSAPATVEVVVENDVITGTVAANIQWTVSGNATDGYTFYPNGSSTTWLYCNTTASSSSNNNMRVGTGNRMVFELNSNSILVTKDTYTKRYLSIYNNQDWRGYVNTNLSPVISFYKKVTSGTPHPIIDATAGSALAYGATSGSIVYEIQNYEAGTMTATTDADWISDFTYEQEEEMGEIGFTVTPNSGAARTANVTLTYTYGDGQTVTAVVAIEQLAFPVPSITVTPATVNVAAEEAEGTLTVTYSNITEVIAEVHFCDAEGQAATYEWIMADIDEGNNVYYVIQANEGEARTAYLKVYALDDNAEDVYSGLVTITQAEYVAPAPDYAALPFEYDGNGQGNLPAGFTVSGLGTYSSSPAMKFDGAGDYAILHFNERPGKLTFDIKGNSFSGGSFAVQTSEDGVTYTDLETYTSLSATQSEEFYVGEAVRYIKWVYTNKVSGNVALGNIVLEKPDNKPIFSPAPGSYTEEQMVALSCVIEGATIYFTTDGSEPTTESEVYAEPITVTEGITTIKAIAVFDTVVSEVVTGVYNINPYASGSLENPYTVQQAIDNTPSSGYVYVSGTVSDIVTTETEVIQYHDISYFISDNIGNRLYVRYGLNVDSTEFYSRSELQLGDRVVVRGRLETGSDSHYTGSRMASNNYLVSLERDVEPPFFSPGSCMLANDENALVYIFSETYEAEIHYTMDGTDPNMNSPVFNEAEPISLVGVTGTVTIKAIAYYEGMHSAVASATYRMVEPGTPGTMETPYTVQEILDLMDSITSIDQVYVRGIVCTDPIIEEGHYYNANYYISDDGTAGEANQLFVYRGKGLGGDPIDSEDDLRKGDIVTVLGDLWIYHSVKEFKQYSIIYEWERPSSITVSSESTDCGEKQGHLDVGYYNIYFQGNPPRVQLCDEQGNAAEYDWITVTLNGSELNFHINAAAETEVPRTAYLKVIGGDWSDNEVVSNIASITQNECVFAPLPFQYADKGSGETDAQAIARLQPVPDGLQVVGLGEHYSSYPYLKFDAADAETGEQDHILLAFDEEPGLLTFDIKGDGFRGGYFYLQTSTDGLDGNWNTIAVYTTAEMITQMSDDNPLKPISKVLNGSTYENQSFDNLTSDVRYIKWVYATRSAGNVRLGDIHLYKPVVYYDVVLNQPEFEGCSISADKAVAAEGEAVTLDYSLAEGYFFIEWNVTDENAGTVAVSDNQFTMPASAVTVEAVIVEATTEYQYVYSVNGVETAPQTAVVGEAITLADGANIDAFEFIGWTTNPNDVENVMPAETSFTIMEDMTFYAVYNYTDTTVEHQYVKVTEDLGDWSGDYLIVYEEGNLAFDGGLETLDAVGNTIEVAIANGIIASDETTDAAKFTIEAVENGYSIKSASGKYMGRSSDANGMNVSDTSVYVNTIYYYDDEMNIVGASGAYLRYNSAANQTRFRYFKSSTYSAQKAIQLYKFTGRADERYTRVFVDNPEGAVAIAGPSIIPSGYVLNVSSVTNELGADKLLIEEGAQLVTSNNVNATMRKTINPYQAEDVDNFYFISSPVNNQDPAQLGMVGGNYDLYYFDQEATDEEWQNYRVEPFNLTTGKGYLYAKANGGTITIAGMMTNSGAGSTTLDGWYLIGNPYPCNVTINVPYYRLDESGAALVETDSSVAIAPMEGVLVHVEGQTIVFTKAPQTSTVGNNDGSKVMFKVRP